jgi:hypothetical protein
LRKVVGFSPNTLYKVYGFSLPPTKTDCHYTIEKLLSMANNDKYECPDELEIIDTTESDKSALYLNILLNIDPSREGPG